MTEEQSCGLGLAILDQTIHMLWFVIGQSSPRRLDLVDPPKFEGLCPYHILFSEFGALKVGGGGISARDQLQAKHNKIIRKSFAAEEGLSGLE